MTAHYFSGLALLALLVGPAIWSGRRLSPEPIGAAVIALAQLTLTTLFAGIAGHLSLPALIALQWIAAAAAATRPPRPRAVAPAPVDAAWAACAVPLALALVHALLAPPLNWDSLAYHLPVVARWIETGSLAGYLPLPAYPAQVTYFPFGGDLAWYWAMAPFGSDFLAGAVNHVFLALSALVVAALARRLGADGPAAALAAALWMLLPIQYASLLGTANVDLYLVFAVLAAAWLAIEGRLALAGAACGLALGAKFTALACLPVLLALALAAGRRPDRSWAAGAALALALAGYWYLRNALATGSPTFPWPGGTLTTAERFVDAPLTGAGLRGLAEAVWNQFGPWSAVAALAWAVHAGVACRAVARSEPDRMLHVAWVASAAFLTGLWAVLPATAYLIPYNLRYALPGLALAAPSVAVALTACDAPPVGAPLVAAQLVACAPHLALPAKWTLVALGVAGLALAAPRAQIVAPLALVLAGQVAFDAHARAAVRLDWFLAGYHGGLMRAPAAWADSLPGNRIALSGALPPFVLAGDHLQNRVISVSTEPGGAVLPHQVPGGLLGAHPDRAAWLAALERAAPDYLVITRLDPAHPWPPEDAWARETPRLRPVVSDATFQALAFTPGARP